VLKPTRACSVCKLRPWYSIQELKGWDECKAGEGLSAHYLLGLGSALDLTYVIFNYQNNLWSGNDHTSYPFCVFKN
jgi:hypothetical protein